MLAVSRTTAKNARAKHRRKSRKGPRLTRGRILASALRILDRDGLDALSMRRLAARLHASPMALYNHVSSKQDLLQSIARDLIDRVDFSCGGDGWCERIRACFRALRNVCLAHPCAVQLIEKIETLPASVFVPMEITLAALEQIGADPQDALRAYFLLTNFTLVQVSYEVRGPFAGVEPAEGLRSGRIDRNAFPHIERAVSMCAWDFERAFEFGMEAILAGLEQTLSRRSSRLMTCDMASNC